MRSKLRVIVGGSYWALNGVNIFSWNLTRGLRKVDIEATIFLTEEDSPLVRVDEARIALPTDVPVDRLKVTHGPSWGGDWGATIRYLETHAPCVYIPNHDWRHSCVIPLLPTEVRIIGVVHSDDPMHYDHVHRLGRYWDAIVATSPTIARKTVERNPNLARRTLVIPIGVDIPDRPPDRQFDSRILRLIYAGTLRRHQKRVFDLLEIMAVAERRGVAVRLTIAGGGPEEAALREAATGLVERGVVSFAGVVEHGGVLRMFAEHDLFLLTSDFEGMPNALLEAMGRGCVPLVTDVESGVRDVVRNGESGLRVKVGDIGGFVDRLAALAADRPQLSALSRGAHAAVSAGRFRDRDMVESYAALCARVSGMAHRARFRRPSGRMNHPPAAIDGIGLLPFGCDYELAGVGAFPARVPDVRDFREELRGVTRAGSPLANLPALQLQPLQRLAGVRVIVTLPAWTGTGIDLFMSTLVRQLNGAGIHAHILLTEEATNLIEVPEPRPARPSEVPIDLLPVRCDEGWGGHWGALLRYLEDHAPCVYMPTYDWRHSCVCPLLSDRVAVVGVVHAADPLNAEHVQRLGRYWDAIVVYDASVARALEADPSLTGRVFPLPYRLEDAARDHVEVFADVFDSRQLTRYRRPHGRLQPPPAAVAGTSVFPVALGFDADGIGAFPTREPDYEDFRRHLASTPSEGAGETPARLRPLR